MPKTHGPDEGESEQPTSQSNQPDDGQNLLSIKSLAEGLVKKIRRIDRQVRKWLKNTTKQQFVLSYAIYSFLFSIYAIVFVEVFRSTMDVGPTAIKFNEKWVWNACFAVLLPISLIGLVASVKRSPKYTRVYFILMPALVLVPLGPTATMFRLQCDCTDYVQCSALKSYAMQYGHVYTIPFPAPNNIIKFKKYIRIPWKPLPASKKPVTLDGEESEELEQTSLEEATFSSPRLNRMSSSGHRHRLHPSGRLAKMSRGSSLSDTVKAVNGDDIHTGPHVLPVGGNHMQSTTSPSPEGAAEQCHVGSLRPNSTGERSVGYNVSGALLDHHRESTLRNVSIGRVWTFSNPPSSGQRLDIRRLYAYEPLKYEMESKVESGETRLIGCRRLKVQREIDHYYYFNAEEDKSDFKKKTLNCRRDKRESPLTRCPPEVEDELRACVDDKACGGVKLEIRKIDEDELSSEGLTSISNTSTNEDERSSNLTSGDSSSIEGFETTQLEDSASKAVATSPTLRNREKAAVDAKQVVNDVRYRTFILNVCLLRSPVDRIATQSHLKMNIGDDDPSWEAMNPLALYFKRDMTHAMSGSNIVFNQMAESSEQSQMSFTHWLHYMSELKESGCHCNPNSRGCVAYRDEEDPKQTGYWCRIKFTSKADCQRNRLPGGGHLHIDLFEMPKLPGQEQDDKEMWTRDLCTIKANPQEGVEQQPRCQCTGHMGFKVRKQEVLKLQPQIVQTATKKDEVFIGYKCDKWYKEDTSRWCVVGFDSACADRTERWISQSKKLRVYTSSIPCERAEIPVIIDQAAQMCRMLRLLWWVTDTLRYLLFPIMFAFVHYWLRMRCQDIPPKNQGWCAENQDLEWEGQETTDTFSAGRHSSRHSVDGSGSASSYTSSDSYSSYSEDDASGDRNRAQESMKKKSQGNSRAKPKPKKKKADSWFDGDG